VVGVEQYASDGPYDLAIGQPLTAAQQNVLDKNGNVYKQGVLEMSDQLLSDQHLHTSRLKFQVTITESGTRW